MNPIILFLLTINSPLSKTSSTLKCNSTSMSNVENKTCSFCIEVVDIIEKYSNLPNATIHDIIKVIEDVCSRIHSPQGKECYYIVKKIENILNWINDGLVPRKICGLLGLCSNR